MTIKPFDCGDADLNDFLLNDAINHQSQLMAATYLWENNEITLAFFCLINDKISREQIESKNRWRTKIGKLVPHMKRGYDSFPSIKIGRLAVCCNNHSCGNGTIILDFIKDKYCNQGQESGCRFITVDAYKKSLNFYLKNGFEFLTENDEGQNTRQMYFDLYSLLK